MKLARAVRNKAECPVDGRCVMKPRRTGDCAGSSRKRQLIHDFLYSLYVKVSENLPEVVTDRPSQVRSCKILQFKKGRGKRPRLRKKRDPKPLRDGNAHQLRQLPPGTYSDYLRMFRAQHADEKVTLGLFCSAP